MSEEEQGEEMEFEVESYGAMEYIQAAYFALSAVEDVDVEILPSEAQKQRIRKIKFKSIRIIEACITELYTDLFDEDN